MSSYYPKSPPSSSLISSRQLVAGSLINDMNAGQYSYQLLTPLGATQITAAPINAANVEIPAAAAAAGVVLPVSYPGAEIDILNNSGNNQNVYPNGTDQIQNAGTTYAAASAAVVLATLVSWRLRCIKQGFWQRVITS